MTNMFNISTNKPQTQLADKKPAVKALRQATLRMKKQLFTVMTMVMPVFVMMTVAVAVFTAAGILAGNERGVQISLYDFINRKFRTTCNDFQPVLGKNCKRSGPHTACENHVSTLL